MQRLVTLALRYRFMVLLATLFVVVLGLFSMRNLLIEGVPDITPNQVLVLTRAPSLSPPEVEQYITFPAEWSMSGLPGITNIYSLSKQGFSYVAVYFKEDMDIYFCRRLVMERLPQAQGLIPPGIGVPEMGPISTGLGEIYQFKVTGGGLSNMELRSTLDWDIAPKLRSVPGVVEVNVAVTPVSGPEPSFVIPTESWTCSPVSHVPFPFPGPPEAQTSPKVAWLTYAACGPQAEAG